MGKKRKKEPLTRGCARVPVVMQLETLECGAAALTMVLAYYDKWIPLEQVRLACGVSRDGSNAKNILMAARAFGFEAKGYRYEPEALRDEGSFPCVIHWNFNHFVVLCGFRGNSAILNDPARGTVKVSMEEFDRAFTGICLTFRPGPEFVPGGKRKSVLSFAGKRLQGAWGAAAFLALTSVIACLFGMIQPVLSRVFLDRLLTGRNPEWLYPFLIALTALSALQIGVSVIQTLTALKINGKMAVIGNASYMWKILRLPMEFFSQRMAGDIQQRRNDNASIASVLASRRFWSIPSRRLPSTRL